MATGGALGPGAALGRGLGLVLLSGGLAVGCGGSGAGEGTPAGARATARSASGSPPSPRATPPEELCARVVAYWSREVLDGDTYGDYQSMGLSNGQYEILRDVVDAARAAKKRESREAAEELIDRGAREGCADWYRDGGPAKGPWQ
ncbi:hypothetical protein [Streptomyces sp. NPDC046862]|uniref:hypothetical protein n=1 Tax=Streptomyces sp. NPDC046862 TaxID=3154603 RepID=UPI003456D2F3